MEPVVVLNTSRRQREEDIEWNRCFICQEKQAPKSSKKDTDTRRATQNGLSRFEKSAKERLKYHDEVYVHTLDRFQSIDLQEESPKLMWHSSCYSDFTHRIHIQRLMRHYEENISTDRDSETQSKSARRSSHAPIDWRKCMFCQGEKKGKLHNVQVMDTSVKILKMAQKDPVLRCKLAGVSDLIAAEGKYHLKCYSQISKRISKTVDESRTESPADICFSDAMDELSEGLLRGEIYSLSTVWSRYCEFLAELDIDPGIYRSNKFKDRVKRAIGDRVRFVRPLNHHECLILFPSVPVDVAVQSFLKASDPMEDSVVNPATCLSPEDDDPDSEILSWMYRVAVKVRTDIRNTPGHDFIGGIDLEHAEKTVPDSLFMFLQLLCSDDNRDEPEDERSHIKLLSIAQDIVSLATDGRNKTPKQIGLALTVHQATRSKELVQLLHAAGHSVSYESVLRMDTSVALDVLKRYSAQGNVVIPLNFMRKELPGYIRYANDNIDIIEETLDGKGAFHASQTASYRRTVPNESHNYIQVEKGQSRSLKVPPEFHEIRTTDIGSSKPEPVFPSEVNGIKQMMVRPPQQKPWTSFRSWRDRTWRKEIPVKKNRFQHGVDSIRECPNRIP